jgi:hypothetical protein
MPIMDTHEFVLFVPFLIQGLGLPVSPFFHGLLDFNSLNLTHFSPNFVLQITIFAHLCEAFLRIRPHFELLKYRYHCNVGMVGGQHQVDGGASLELHRGRKVEYLDIPLKDNSEGWRFEWFTMETHNNSLPTLSRRQPDVLVPSWIEAQTNSNVADARFLLAEITSLKYRGQTVEAVVIDFVFKNTQPLKDRVHPTYVYTRVRDPSHMTNKQILEEDVLSRVEMMLRGAIVNVSAPRSYSA